MSEQPRVLVACPTWHGGEYALKQWAAAFHAQTYPNRGAFMVDNSEDNPSGLHYAHTIRGQGIDSTWLVKKLPSFWDTMELCWVGPGGIVEHAHDEGYDFILSVEHDVIIGPDAMQIMVDKAFEYAEDGKPAVVSHEVHPRGQDGIDFHWDTIACTLLPTEPLYADRFLAKATYEIECFIVCKRHGYPRYRATDLFSIQHLKDPEDPRGDDGFSGTPAHDTYALRKITYNKDKAVVLNAEEARKQLMENLAEKEKAEKQIMTEPAHLVGSGKPSAAPATLTVKGETPKTYKMRKPLPEWDDSPPINLQGVKDESELVKVVSDGGRLRLNLGSGYQQIAGFVGVDFDESLDPDVVSTVQDLSWCPTDSCDMVFASHVLEHLTLQDSRVALKEWLRVLKPGGFLDVAVPDVNQIYTMWRKGSQWGEYQQNVDELYINATAFGANLLADAIPEMQDMYGGPGHQHKQIFIHDMLVQRVLEAGFVEVHEVNVNFMRRSSMGEVMVQARKIWFPPIPPMPDQPMLTKE